MSEMAEPGMSAAEDQVRLILLGTGALTVDQANRHAPGLARAVVTAYFTGLVEPTTPAAEPEGL